MKVILTAQIAKLGQIGEVVQVRNGFAKNFLIPNKKAICFTPNSQKLFEAKRAEFEKANEDQLSLAKKVKDKLIGQNVVVIENASDDGRLYGSVNALVIADKINQIIKEKSVEKTAVNLSNPIKDLGVYIVKINLHPEVLFEVKVVVSRAESEVEAVLKAYEKSKREAAEVVEVKEKKSKKKAEGESDTEIAQAEEVKTEV